MCQQTEETSLGPPEEDGDEVIRIGNYPECEAAVFLITQGCASLPLFFRWWNTSQRLWVRLHLERTRGNRRCHRVELSLVSRYDSAHWSHLDKVLVLLGNVEIFADVTRNVHREYKNGLLVIVKHLKDYRVRAKACSEEIESHMIVEANWKYAKLLTKDVTTFSIPPLSLLFPIVFKYIFTKNLIRSGLLGVKNKKSVWFSWKIFDYDLIWSYFRLSYNLTA